MDSKQLAEWCRKIGLPTDCPLQINGKKDILEFIKELRNHRDVMTVDLLQKILKKNGLQYDLSKHCTIVKSPVLEGFIITLRNEKGEKLVLKYKFPFYTAVTMFLREYTRSKNNTKPTAKPFVVETNISDFLKRWVFDKSVAMQSLWSWILHEMVRVADSQTFEGPVAPWIQVSELVYARVFAALAANGNDVTKVCELLKCPMLEQQKGSLFEVTIALVFGPIGFGKSTFASYMATLSNSVHIDGDGNEAWLPKDLVLALKGERNSRQSLQFCLRFKQARMLCSRQVVVRSGHFPTVDRKLCIVKQSLFWRQRLKKWASNSNLWSTFRITWKLNMLNLKKLGLQLKAEKPVARNGVMKNSFRIFVHRLQKH